MEASAPPNILIFAKFKKKKKSNTQNADRIECIPSDESIFTDIWSKKILRWLRNQRSINARNRLQLGQSRRRRRQTSFGYWARALRKPPVYKYRHIAVHGLMDDGHDAAAHATRITFTGVMRPSISKFKRRQLSSSPFSPSQANTTYACDVMSDVSFIHAAQCNVLIKSIYWFYKAHLYIWKQRKNNSNYRIKYCKLL